jgi:hypothetical protein
MLLRSTSFTCTTFGSAHGCAYVYCVGNPLYHRAHHTYKPILAEIKPYSIQLLLLVLELIVNKILVAISLGTKEYIKHVGE